MESEILSTIASTEEMMIDAMAKDFPRAAFSMTGGTTWFHIWSPGKDRSASVTQDTQ